MTGFIDRLDVVLRDLATEQTLGHYVPLSVRHGNRRARLRYLAQEARERVAKRLAPWIGTTGTTARHLDATIARLERIEADLEPIPYNLTSAGLEAIR